VRSQVRAESDSLTNAMSAAAAATGPNGKRDFYSTSGDDWSRRLSQGCRGLEGRTWE